MATRDSIGLFNRSENDPVPVRATGAGSLDSQWVGRGASSLKGIRLLPSYTAGRRGARSFRASSCADVQSGLAGPAFVRRRAIDGGDRNVDQPQVHAQLTAVVDEVVDGLTHHHAAGHG